MFAKRIARKTRQRIAGYFRKSVRNPYGFLRRMPRYIETEITLLEKPFIVPDGLSFYCSYSEIFLDLIYRFKIDTPAPRIIDCGANCGTSVAYFKQLYPFSRITAVEADPAIFQILSRNVDNLGMADVWLIARAVWHLPRSASFHCEGADGGRIQCFDGAQSVVDVPTISLDELIGDDQIDFLKMDIEGAEVDVLNSAKRLDQVNRIFVEYHSFREQPQRLTEMLNVLDRAGFRHYLQTQFCPPQPLIDTKDRLGMDLQLNVFGIRS